MLQCIYKLFSEDNSMKIMTALKKSLLIILSSSLFLTPVLCSCSNGVPKDTDRETESADTSDSETANGDTTSVLPPDTDPYEENFVHVPLPELDSWDGVRVTSSGTLDGDAVLYGEGISLVYDEAFGQNVLSMTGGAGYLKLPNEIWENTKDGFTVSFSAKPDTSVPNTANLFQTNLCGYGVGDTEWRDAPEISLNMAGNLRIYVGGRTINGVYNAVSTYNNGGPGDAKDYAEPHGLKPRFNATTKPISKGKWSEIVISVSTDAVKMYVNGEEVDVKRVSSESGNLRSALNYLFGNYKDGEYQLGKYINTSIGNSVYADTGNYKGLIGNIRIYTCALSADEAKKTAPDYLWNFNGDCVFDEELTYATPEDLEKYGDTPLTSVDELKTLSPDGKTEFAIRRDENGSYYYSVVDEGTVLVLSSKLGMILTDYDLSNGLLLKEGSVIKGSVNEPYMSFTGMNRESLDEHNETRFTLENSVGSFDLVIEVHNDGAAFRYENVTVFDETAKVTVEKECTEILLPSTSTTWSHIINATYEAEFVKRNPAQLESLTAKLSTPFLVRDQEHYMLISQAGMLTNNAEYCACGLATESGSLTLRWQFGLDRDPKREATGELDRPGHIDIVKLKTVNGFSTPWRVLIISKDLDEFTESTIMTDLNPSPDPELFADISYIKPGRVAWSWWSEEGEQGNYNKHIEYIDFAAANGWEYVCLDAYWREFEPRLAEMCEYAEEKGIGIFVWVNYRDLKNEANMKKLITSWAEAGVVGLKTDYFESDAPNVLEVMEKTAICTAENRLMLLYHGCVHPGGENRTYPNVLSWEAVLGEENHKWSRLPTVTSCLTFPFTRNICGPMDYTPVATKIASSDVSYGFALAMTVVYESGLQHYAYSAAGYKLYSGLSFLNNAAVTWHESHFIDGAPGEHITVARKNGETWYIGSMTDEPRQVKVPLTFLGNGTYNIYTYTDSKDGAKLVITEGTATASDILTLDLIKNGGAAIIITKEKLDISVEGAVNDSEYTYYEAESPTNKLAGAAVTQSSAFCSGGGKVGYIGNGSANTLTFEKITVTEDGTYSLLLYYCCGEARSVILTVNGETEYTLTGLNSGSYTHPTFIEVEIELKAGENTVKLSQPTYYAPDIDMIAISKEHK